MQKASRMLTPCGGVQPVFHISKPFSSPECLRLQSSHLRPRARSLPPYLLPCHRRPYATESTPPSSLEPSRNPSGEDLSWPTTNPNNPYEIPTPYQIFKMSPSDPYSKRRFYSLVKLYHPDTQQFDKSSHAPLSAAARLQRYRIVIAANELLSDPRRRRMYDTQGVGWSGRPEFGPTRPRWEYENQGKKGWSGFENNMEDDPRMNATWEDWESWQLRQERTKGEQRPVYMNNGTFVVLICIAAGIAASAEGRRAGIDGRTMLEQVEARHARNSVELLRRREESRGWGGEGRDERTREFLRVRGPVAKELEMAPVGQEREGTLFVKDEDVERDGRR